MISAALFDLDGTLVETEELKAISHGRAVSELRLDLGESEGRDLYANELVGKPRREVANEFIEHFELEEAIHKVSEPGEEPWETLVRIRRGIYEELLEDSDLLWEKRYPHNIDLLREMKERGYPTACATMSHREQAERVLAVLGLGSAFEVIATADEVERGKPNPEIDLLVARKMSVPPEEFVVIEDSRAGVEAAVAAGMAVVAMTTRITREAVHASELLDEKWIVDDPESLDEVVHQRIKESGGGRDNG